ncbi:hypothetical protein CsSME_00001810 [Camellia sinensis var. sinensis]
MKVSYTNCALRTSTTAEPTDLNTVISFKSLLPTLSPSINSTNFPAISLGLITPLSNAPTSSPASTAAASLSTNTLPLRIASSSHSLIECLNDPTKSKCAPSFSAAPFTSASSEFVAQLTISASPTASSNRSLLSKPIPSNSTSLRIFSTSDLPFAALRFQIVTFFMFGLDVRWALIKCGASEPAPIIARTWESCRDR